jgi:hypothetical protein
MWNAFFCALSAAACLFCLIGCTRAVQRVREDSASLVAEVRLNTSRIQSLTESHELSVDELKNLANRVKMQRVRNATDHATNSKSDGEPDPIRDPDRWRAWMNRKIAMARLNGSTN